MEVLSASFGGVIKQQIKMRRCPIKLKIQLKILVALITLVDRICLLILLSCTIQLPPPPQPDHSSSTSTLTPSLVSCVSSVFISTVLQQENYRSSLCAKGNAGEKGNDCHSFFWS